MKSKSGRFLRVAILFAAMLSLHQTSVVAGDLDAIPSKTPSVPGLARKLTDNVEVVSLEDKGREICESLMQADAEKTPHCVKAVEVCADTIKYASLLVALNKHCTYNIDRWICSYTKWPLVESEVKSQIAVYNKDEITKECVPEVLNFQGINKVKTIPVIPADSSPKDPTKDSTGALKPDSASSDTPASGKSMGATDMGSGCSMNPLAFGNVWSGFVSYLPFFILTFFYGFKRKDK